MNWRLIVKTASDLVPPYNYDIWKEMLSEEGHRQCVYCSLDENTGGGIKFFEIEHYQPESKFKALARDYDNLFFACAICNGFKNNDWKDADTTDLSLIIYPKPSVTDYSTLFDVNFNDGNISGKFSCSKYLVTKLYLNRPQLIIYRKYSFVNSKYEQIKSWLYLNIDSLIEKAENGVPGALDLIRNANEMLGKIDNYKTNTLDKTRLYSLIQIRRPELSKR